MFSDPRTTAREAAANRGKLLNSDRHTFVTAEKLPSFLTKIRSGEALAGLHLTLVARFTTDTWARRHLTRHAADEMKHALIFEQIARQLDLEEAVSFPALDNEPRKDRFALHELTPLTGPLYNALLEGRAAPELAIDVPKLKIIVHELHAAEKLGLAIFYGIDDLLANDERASILGSPLRRTNARKLLADLIDDERYHIAWTANALRRWSDIPDVRSRVKESRSDEQQNCGDSQFG